MRTLIIGVASLDYIRQRTIDIAAGRIVPKKTDPKIWFTSLESLGRILNDNNRAMLDAIREHHPATVSELARLIGREQGNVSRTLSKMVEFHMVELVDNGASKMPVVDWDEINIKTQHALAA